MSRECKNLLVMAHQIVALVGVNAVEVSVSTTTAKERHELTVTSRLAAATDITRPSSTMGEKADAGAAAAELVVVVVLKAGGKAPLPPHERRCPIFCRRRSCAASARGVFAAIARLHSYRSARIKPQGKSYSASSRNIPLHHYSPSTRAAVRCGLDCALCRQLAEPAVHVVFDTA